VPAEIYVDADACPVKPEILKVAERHGLRVTLVANSGLRPSRDPMVRNIIVSAAFDAADNWIAENAGKDDIVVTADVPLAARAFRNGASVISPTGKAFDDDSIHMALATRNLMTDLRSAGAETRGPRPLSRQDVSRFLSALDLAVVRIKRKMAGQG